MVRSAELALADHSLDEEGKRSKAMAFMERPIAEDDAATGKRMTQIRSVLRILLLCVIVRKIMYSLFGLPYIFVKCLSHFGEPCECNYVAL